MVALTDCPQIPARASDEFMIYQFKVLPCTRKGAHSWTECAFTHPGEKAARRCPKSFIYSAEACPDARKSGKCIRGDMCPYSHGVFEQWLHPSRYRTQLCSFGTACRRPVCFFAHTVQELRVPTGCGPNPQAITSPMQGDMQNAAAAEVAASMSRQASANCPSLFDSYLLQQAMAGGACYPGACSPFGGLPPTSLAAAAAAASTASPGSGASMFGAPWMPCASGGFACGPYPSPVMPATPANSNGMEAYSAAQLTRQLSLQQQG
ncbi:hypothetical protein OEZ85_006878 [Tetradesmus obliquus]|uniref:C3H1-type domain-containing protein n=1 Tax=Tetradesmus obliquus TaxID=3088 RepID=A0ABY8TWQ4_TETOB|nr:hypothetical protein OEZ85_006878 [Tetradesmus obliquus]